MKKQVTIQRAQTAACRVINVLQHHLPDCWREHLVTECGLGEKDLPYRPAYPLPTDHAKAALHMDWGQVVCNGGPPCFQIEESGHFCGRAQRWHSDDTHRFVGLEEIL